MNDNERAALVDELAEAMLHIPMRTTEYDHHRIEIATACLPIITRLLAAHDLDALLDDLHPRAAIARMERDSRHKWYIRVQWVTMPDTSPILHTCVGAGPTRMAAIRAAVAKAKETHDDRRD